MKMPELLAVYLPQFYENEQNNSWWGKGFTDWVTVQTATELFPGEGQPKRPLSGDYYDLLKKESMEKQARLAREYGIDGFCFYHYYFADGRMTLEKPAENLLRWTDLDMPFCFNWASEPWIRSWSRISGNVWGEQIEKRQAIPENRDSGVLMPQDFGGAAEWRDHFDYLLPFFRDKRYIKREGCPVFIFYTIKNIVCYEEMAACWRKWAAEAGLPGLYLIASHIEAPRAEVDAAIIYEPRNSIVRLNQEGASFLQNGVRCFDYERLWDRLLRSYSIPGLPTCFCGVTGYDDTPRRGVNGECLVNKSPALFERKLSELLRKGAAAESPYVFLNAWNEWGEGMYLEPDEADAYLYLEAVRGAKRTAALAMQREEDRKDAPKEEYLRDLIRKSDRFEYLHRVLNKWLLLLEQDGEQSSLRRFFKRHEIESLAVYGVGLLGKHLLTQLEQEKGLLRYGIDRYVGDIAGKLKIYRPEEELPPADALVITAFGGAALREGFRSRFREVYLLEEILEELIAEKAIF